MPALLSMRDICKSFFGIPANDRVSLEVGEGEIHALLGENGAGKTTLMNILYGIYARDLGDIVWRGKPYVAKSPGDAIRQGIGMVHQHFMLVPTLTVSENITLGLRSPGYPFVDRKKLDSEIRVISEKYGLDLDPGARISALSVGEQQRVEIMKLLYRNAGLLILDEPTAVLTPGETRNFFGVLGRLREEGHSVILITHRIPEVLAVTDRISVLRDGAKIATLDTAEADAGELSRLMIGRNLKPVSRTARPAGFADSAPVLEVSLPVLTGAREAGSREVGLRGAGDAASEIAGPRFSLGAGEIFGIAGVDGNGQKELAEHILGLRRPHGRTASRGDRVRERAKMTAPGSPSGAPEGAVSGSAAGAGGAAISGSISISGLALDCMSVAERKKLGLAYISDDRHGDGLVLGMDLAENYLLNLKSSKTFVRGGFIDRRACLAATGEAVTAFGIKTPGLSRPVSLLSGGNQQKLILARELSGSPVVIVAFQPTRGLDIGAAEFIRERILERGAAGCAVLLISADLEEILALSDRIAVMYRGRLSDPVPNDSRLDMTRLGLLMAGHGAAECA